MATTNATISPVPTCKTVGPRIAVSRHVPPCVA
jgi:hypothetical protein